MTKQTRELVVRGNERCRTNPLLLQGMRLGSISTMTTPQVVSRRKPHFRLTTGAFHSDGSSSNACTRVFT